MEQHVPPEEGRIKRSSKVTESISNSRTTIIMNLTIEFLSAAVLFTGIIYFFRFMFFFRNRMADTSFRIFLGAMLVFSAGWFTFIFFKLREHFRMLMKNIKGDDSTQS